MPPREIVICKELYNRQYPDPLYTVILFLKINNLLKLHKNARLSLFVEIGGVLYPQSTTSIANNGARSYFKKSKQALEKKNNQTDQKSPYFFVAPFSSPTLYISIITHTHTSTLSSAVLTKVTWFLHRFELSSLIHETEKAFEDIVQYCIKEGLCYVSISRLKSFKKTPHTHEL